MQPSGAVHAPTMVHRRKPLRVLLAIAAIVVIAALVVLAGALMTSTSVPEDMAPAAVPAAIHDDAGNVR
jgi:hypothetical protein